MISQLRSQITRLRESLYFIPSVVLGLCSLLAIGTLFIDDRYRGSIETSPLLIDVTVEGGRAIATAVAGATMTVAAIVFSVTALSTQMASSQYSPRSLGGFNEDPVQQFTIGLVVGTFSFSLIILAGLGDALDQSAQPSLSVTVALVLGVSSAIAIVVYINHSLRRMTIDSVVRRLADSALKAVHRELGRTIDEPTPEGSPPTGDPMTVSAQKSGWVVQVRPERMWNDLEPEAAVRIEVRLGEAVSVGDILATIWPQTDASESLSDTVRSSVVVAHERSVETDPTFGIRQLVDIALRALSPGVNDPTTAVDVIHHLKPPLREVLLSEPPRRVLTGDEGRRVYLPETPSRSDYVHMAFSEIRLSAGSQPEVYRALLEVLDDLRRDVAETRFDNRASAITKQYDLVVEAARSSGLPEFDLDRLVEDLPSTTKEET